MTAAVPRRARGSGPPVAPGACALSGAGPGRAGQRFDGTRETHGGRRPVAAAVAAADRFRQRPAAVQRAGAEQPLPAVIRAAELGCRSWPQPQCRHAAVWVMRSTAGSGEAPHQRARDPTGPARDAAWTWTHALSSGCAQRGTGRPTAAAKMKHRRSSGGGGRQISGTRSARRSTRAAARSRSVWRRRTGWWRSRRRRRSTTRRRRRREVVVVRLSALLAYTRPAEWAGSTAVRCSHCSGHTGKLLLKQHCKVKL